MIAAARIRIALGIGIACALVGAAWAEPPDFTEDQRRRVCHGLLAQVAVAEYTYRALFEGAPEQAADPEVDLPWLDMATNGLVTAVWAKRYHHDEPWEMYPDGTSPVEILRNREIECEDVALPLESYLPAALTAPGVGTGAGAGVGSGADTLYGLPGADGP